MAKAIRQKMVPLCFMLSVLLVTGCASTGAGKLPEWVLSPPADTSSTIYGVGEGAALRSARDDALAVIAGKLETHVTSDVQTETVLANGQERSTTRNNVRTTTEALKLSDYQTVNSAQVASRLFVMVSMDRRSLVTSILNDLERLDGEIEARLAGTEDSSKLKRLYRLILARNLLSEAIDKALLAQSVSQDSSLKKSRVIRYQSLQEERERLQQSLTVAVSWDKNSSGIGEKILSMLLAKGLHAEAGKPSEHYDGRIVVSGRPSQREIFNEYHVQLDAVVSLQDNRESEISSARYKAAASSLSNYGAAEKTANRLIAEEIEERGIWRALNMHRGT